MAILLQIRNIKIFEFFFRVLKYKTCLFDERPLLTKFVVLIYVAFIHDIAEGSSFRQPFASSVCTDLCIQCASLQINL
jgi:hypothetical protein